MERIFGGIDRFRAEGNKEGVERLRDKVSRMVGNEVDAEGSVVTFVEARGGLDTFRIS